MDQLLFLLCCSVLMPPTALSPLYLITAPNIIHVGVPETIAIQLDGIEKSVKMKVYLFDINTYTRCSDEVEFELNAKNDYCDYKDIVALPRRIKEAKIWSRRTKYINLVVQCPELFTERRMVPILLSSKKGYIFIQTDKPIYTPNENVQFRIFTLDRYMRPVDETIKITTYNSRDMRFPSYLLNSKYGLFQKLKIPGIAKPGIWRIEAQFDDSPMSMASAQFEVKEFVLPSFSVVVNLEHAFYLVTKAEFKFDISAQHTYGKGVEGMAYVRFGIIDGMQNKTYIRGLEQQLQIKRGSVESSLITATLEKKLKNLGRMTDFVGYHLYMAVTVFETASGEMEESEVKNVKLVSSPYVIDLSKTRDYFIPRFPFYVLAKVTYPDGTPASGVPVRLEGTMPKNTMENGQAEFVIQKLADKEDSFNIKVIAGDGAETTEANKNVSSYHSNNKRYLNINVPRDVIDPSSSILAEVQSDSTPDSQDSKHYYYIATSKGKILKMGKALKGDFVKIPIQLSTAMVPAFRLVTYYYANIEGNTEMVANSAWIDVKDVCEGKITIKDMPNTYRPGSEVSLHIKTEDQGKLSLGIVDTAAYVLNSKNRLKPVKVFEEMNSYDLGCTYGGGANSVGVFMDAGLTFISNVHTSEIRTGYSCKTDNKRMKRSLDIQQQYMGKANQYNNNLKKCCMDGLTLIPMKRSCKDRAVRIKDDECRKVFLTCCDFGVEQRKNQSQKLNTIGRQIGDNEDDVFDEHSVNIRSYFPQSWHWKTYSGTHAGENQFNVVLPDSITTWEVQAVGMFNNKGFCVAEPKTIKVFKEFFISLRLPYSVKRNEQLEVRAILYNYHHDEIQVKVYMKPVDNLCSPATGRNQERNVTVQAKSAISVYFSVVPLTIGDIPITVAAYRTGFSKISDVVTKKLKVLGEGVLKTEEQSISIDPRGKYCIPFRKRFHVERQQNSRSSYQVLEAKPPNMVPDTKSYLYIRARGHVMGETVENSLSPEGIDKLIQLPTGCTEQTTSKLAPTVFAVNYLDKSDQWLYLRPELKDDALSHIRAGYKRILEHKSAIGAYGSFNDYPGSTWLTAFIVKILSIASTQVEVKEDSVQDSVSFLLQSQTPAGEFYDAFPMFPTLQAGIKEESAKVPTTAFVAIALMRSRVFFHEGLEIRKHVDANISKAIEYLSGELANIERPYSLIITAYALALFDPESSAAREADEKLKAIAMYDQENAVRFWDDEGAPHSGGTGQPGRGQASAVNVETTAYALLQTLAMKDLQYAKPIVKWLTEQRSFGGGYRSTQDTVVALEALSEYSIATFQPEQLDLHFTFSHPKQKSKQVLNVQQRNALLQDELKFPFGYNISIEVKGKGTGTLTFLKSYLLLSEPKNTCDYFRLEVMVKGKVEYEAPEYNYEDYDKLMPADQPLSEIDWFDLRSRARRQAPDPEEDRTIYYEVCAWHEPDKNRRASGMAIVDISLLSGFEPKAADLNKLKTLVDRYINEYEFKDGRVLLYLEKVTEHRECIVFAAKQIIPIGLIQPASATLYDYYNPSTKCTIFYNAPEQNTIALKLCQHDVCQCAEGRCPRMKKTFSTELAEDARVRFACYSPIVDYAFVANVLQIDTIGSFQVYKVAITKRIKLASDESIQVNDIRHFLKSTACPLKLEPLKSYLFMGKDGQTKDENHNTQYILDSKSWVEEMPSQEKCKGTRQRRVCKELDQFIDDLKTTGCQL
ncbi:complement C4-like [Stegostoma tigrinum]|uniref:complement C4-like n=1 Tax=Stegostoma tigrinum TaxID=3053191 RepID=UPI00287043E2|nr:complement C4-like [Stegostoma tigrinum]